MRSNLHAAAPDVGIVMPPMQISLRQQLVSALACGCALTLRPVQAQSVIATDSAGPATGRNVATGRVAQEVFGLHQHIKHRCRRFAQLGYFAISVAAP